MCIRDSSSSELPHTFSLLQEIQSFVQSGKSVYFSFFHLKFQEALAAYYIATCLPVSGQVSKFRQLFGRPRFSGVLKFYSAITKLQTPGIKEIVTRIVKGKSKPLLVSLIHCLFGAQDPSLCHYVVKQLDDWDALDLSSTSLSQVDFIFIGYFLSTLTCNTQIVKKVRFWHCKISDDNVKNLALYMCRSSSPCGWRMDMNVNNIHDEGASSIAEILSAGSVLNSLELNSNPIGGKGLQSISEALITNSSLVELRLASCKLVITEENGPVFTEMLQRNKTLRHLNLGSNNLSDIGAFYFGKGLRENITLKKLVLHGCGFTSRGAEDLSIMSAQEDLDIGWNAIGDQGMAHLAESFKKIKTLKCLDTSHCGLTSRGAEDLSKALAQNSSLERLRIEQNAIGDQGIAHLAESLKKNQTLKHLYVCLLYTSPSPRDATLSRMPSSA